MVHYPLLIMYCSVNPTAIIPIYLGLGQVLWIGMEPIQLAMSLSYVSVVDSHSPNNLAS